MALPIEIEGMPPASLQLIGRRWGEADLLAIGLGLEESGAVKVAESPASKAPPCSSQAPRVPPASWGDMFEVRSSGMELLDPFRLAVLGTFP